MVGLLWVGAPTGVQEPTGGVALPASEKGLEITRRLDALPQGRDLFAADTWHLFERGGGERVRQTRSFRRTIAGEGAPQRSKRLVVVDGPRRVKGIGLLVWRGGSPGDREQQWPYVPTRRRV